MDTGSEQLLVYLLRTLRVAAFGTSRDGAPFVSMVSLATRRTHPRFISTLAVWPSTRVTWKPTRTSVSCWLKWTMAAQIRKLWRGVTIQCRAEKFERDGKSYSPILKTIPGANSRLRADVFVWRF